MFAADTHPDGGPRRGRHLNHGRAVDSDTPMAPRLSAIEPPATPPTPGLSFQFTCDDYDGHDGHDDDDKDRDRDRDEDNSDENVHDHSHSHGSHNTHGHLLAASPRSSPAAFLHPHHSTSLSPPSHDPVFIMATDDGPANGGADAPAPKNPFNFQTQFISAGPVKSVRWLCCVLSEAIFPLIIEADEIWGSQN